MHVEGIDKPWHKQYIDFGKGYGKGFHDLLHFLMYKVTNGHMFPDPKVLDLNFICDNFVSDASSKSRYQQDYHTINE